MLDSRVLSSTAETLDGCGSGPSAKPSLGCIIFFFFLIPAWLVLGHVMQTRSLPKIQELSFVPSSPIGSLYFSFDTWVLDRVENLCMPKEDHCWSLMFCKSSYSLVVSLKRGKIFFSPKSRYFVFTMFLWVKEPSFQISLFMYENPVQWSSGFFSSDFKSWQTCIS